MEQKVYKKRITFEIELSTIIGKPFLESRTEDISNALHGLVQLIDDIEAVQTKTSIFVTATEEVVGEDKGPKDQ